MCGAHDDIGDFVPWRSDENPGMFQNAMIEALVNEWWDATAETASAVYVKIRAIADT
jgi:hypothetical protein